MAKGEPNKAASEIEQSVFWGWHHVAAAVVEYQSEGATREEAIQEVLKRVAGGVNAILDYWDQSEHSPLTRAMDKWLETNEFPPLSVWDEERRADAAALNKRES